jgi:hypothetical protein
VHQRKRDVQVIIDTGPEGFVRSLRVETNAGVSAPREVNAENCAKVVE